MIAALRQNILKPIQWKILIKKIIQVESRGIWNINKGIFSMGNTVRVTFNMQMSIKVLYYFFIQKYCLELTHSNIVQNLI